ncbi:hypothetical protein CHS0354_025628 [Potamilus streckersoni]|uniref:Ig-like domain-containing protein n=1 Tax=Potamilus streckersoni TaxID=2493646 RepID=A0AAE0S1Z3_9BIVA|nr:hypothetical protein CHS0354_025628 [Potamilus streckersoni]
MTTTNTFCCKYNLMRNQLKDGNMSFLFIVFCFFTVHNISEEKTIQGIIGRNVTFSWTFKNIINDDIYILRNKSFIHQVLPPKDPSHPNTLPDRVNVSVSNVAADDIKVTVDIFNITENDAATYSLVQLWKLQDLDDIVHLKTVDEISIPKIAIVPHNVLDLSLVLECRVFITSTVEYVWRVNGSLIGNHGKYSLNDTFLSIRNLTIDDQYDVYTCNMSESGFESDPYSIIMSGPNVIKFAPNITMVKEYSGLTVSCLADCSPICSWKWTKLNVSEGQDNVISTSNILHIRNITRHDGGIYSCNVLNKVTGMELVNLTPIQIMYGPDSISFNSSVKIIQMNEKDSKTISCSADCFPNCHISWTETTSEILINGPELKLFSVNRNVNYTCYASNANIDNSTISDTIYVIVKSELPFKRHLMYVLLGSGITVAVAFLACLLYKLTKWLHVDRVSNRSAVTDCKKDDRDENLKEEVPSGNYWTIVCSEEGELNSVIETEFERHRQNQLIGQKITSTNSELKLLMRPREVHQVIVEVEGYLNPIEAYPVELDDYIHPIHSDPVHSGFVPACQSTEV